MAPGPQPIRNTPAAQPAPAPTTPVEVPYGPPPPPPQASVPAGVGVPSTPTSGPISLLARDPNLPAGMTEAGKKLKALQDEIQDLRAEVKTATGERLSEAVERLAKLEKAVRQASALDQPTLQSQTYAALVRESQFKILSGAMDGDAKVYEEGLSLKKTLERYAVVEGVVQRIARLYPGNSRFVFETDFTKDNPAVRGVTPDPLEPSVEFLSKLPVVTEWNALKGSGDPKHKEMSAAVDGLFKYLRTHRGDPAATRESLEAATAELEKLIQPAVKTFLQRVEDRQAEQMRENPDFKARLETEACLTALEESRKLEQKLQAIDEKGLGNIRSEDCSEMREYFVKWTWSYKRSLDVDLAKVRSELAEIPPAEENAPALSHNVLMRDFLTEKEAKLAKESEEVGRTITRLRTLTISEGNVTESIAALRRELPVIMRHKEAHLRELLGRQIGQVRQIPSDEKGIEKISAEFRDLTPEKTPDLGERIKAYRDISTRLDSVSLRRVVDARIRMYETYQKEVGISDRIHQFLPYWMKSDGRLGDPDQRSLFDPAITRYRRVRDLLNSGDPAKVQEARTLFADAEQAGGHKKWESVYRDAATLNQYTIGLGIITASALLAYLGGVGLAPLLPTEVVGGATVLTAGSQMALFASNVAIFTGVETGLHSWAYEEAPTLEGFAWKLATNAAMFKYIGKSMEVFEKIFGKSVVGAFAWEMVAFQGWEFYPALAKSIAANWDKGIGAGFDVAADQGLSPKAWGHSLAFLLGMKIMFHAGKTPADAFLMSSEARALEREMGQTLEAVRDFMDRPDGDPVALLQRYQSVLRLQADFLRKDPTAYREALAENERLQRQVAEFPKTSAAFVGLFGEGNRFGIRHREDGGPISYRPIWRAELVKSLRSLFGADQVEVHPNGLIEVGDLRFVPPRKKMEKRPERRAPAVPQLAKAQ